MPTSMPISTNKIATQLEHIIEKTKTHDILPTTSLLELLHTRTVYLAVENQKETVGIIATNTQTGDIELLCIHPDHQNKGLGKTLLTKTIAPYSRTDYTFAAFNTVIPYTNTRTINLFKKHNFIETDRSPIHIKLTRSI